MLCLIPVYSLIYRPKTPRLPGRPFALSVSRGSEVGSTVGLTVGLRVGLTVGLLVGGHGGGGDMPLLEGGVPLVDLHNHYNTTNSYDYDYISYEIDYKSSKRPFLRPWA